MNEDLVIFTIEFTVDEIQSVAEPNFGRKLTEDELKKFDEFYFEDDRAFDARIELLASVIEAIMSDEDND